MGDCMINTKDALRPHRSYEPQHLPCKILYPNNAPHPSCKISNPNNAPHPSCGSIGNKFEFILHVYAFHIVGKIVLYFENIFKDFSNVKPNIK